MILIDTNIVIDFWRTGNKNIKSIILNYPVYICGVVTAELCHGAKSEQDLLKILNLVNAFPNIDISNNLWGTIGKNLYKLRINGISVPFQDVIISTLAINNSLKVWTYDKHFELIKSVLDDLKIFNETQYL